MLRVACAVIFHENKILVTQRGPSMKMPYKWEFPGGKIEAGENPDECIKREIMEELNISINIKRLLHPVVHKYSDFIIELFPFVADYASGIITLKEHMQCTWLPPEKLKDLDWAEADAGIVDEVLKSLK